jgi:hypothetical protein
MRASPSHSLLRKGSQHLVMSTLNTHITLLSTITLLFRYQYLIPFHTLRYMTMTPQLRNMLYHWYNLIQGLKSSYPLIETDIKLGEMDTYIFLNFHYIPSNNDTIGYACFNNERPKQQIISIPDESFLSLKTPKQVYDFVCNISTILPVIILPQVDSLSSYITTILFEWLGCYDMVQFYPYNIITCNSITQDFPVLQVYGKSWEANIMLSDILKCV